VKKGFMISRNPAVIEIQSLNGNERKQRDVKNTL
jgi:hypothetical protein